MFPTNFIKNIFLKVLISIFFPLIFLLTILMFMIPIFDPSYLLFNKIIYVNLKDCNFINSHKKFLVEFV